MMERSDKYDYGLTKPHLQLFVNPQKNDPLIAKMEHAYGTLWDFKEHISTWSFGVNWWKNYVYLRYRIQRKMTYLPWNINEKVTLIEDHKENYVVIGLREVDDNRKHKDHCHSIVINVKSQHAKFDLKNLMSFLEGSQMESLNEELENNHYSPWIDSTTKSNASRLRQIFQTLDRYALENVERRPGIGRSSAQEQRPSSKEVLVPNTSLPAFASRGSRLGQSISEPKRKDGPHSQGEESTRKRRKTTSGRTGGTGSSASALTTLSAKISPTPEQKPDYERFAVIQQKFWAEHEDCFLNNFGTVKIHIQQCIIVKGEYVICTLQRDIVDVVKNKLIQLIDVKQRQKVCLTPVDSKHQLLKKKPEKWDNIKNGRFMIINGQHSITASQELQKGGCGEEQCEKLQTWDAFIVWSLDPTKLQIISKFYNITNHLDHAQPTWGNQIISCTNIWVTYKRVTDIDTDPAVRKNKSVYNVQNYKVCRIQPILDPTIPTMNMASLF